jgi:HlyD family secretion protein
MDRKIEKKTGPLNYLLALAGIGGTVCLLAFLMLRDPSASKLRVDAKRITVSVVEDGEFEEYYPFEGTVEPVISVYLDVEEGGRVDEILAEGGQWVEKGAMILRISNAGLQRDSIDTETRLLENLDQLRNTQFNRAQSQLILRENLLALDYQILGLEKKHQRYEVLFEQAGGLAEQQFEAVTDELAYLARRRALLQERIQQEDLLSKRQLEQANSSIKRQTVSLAMLSSIVDSLDVRAPISGHLSSIDAELGQSIGRGQRIGQIDLLDDFKLRVGIDQYYISKVNVDTVGHLVMDQKRLGVMVKKIYPEVIANEFAVDMNFAGELPTELRRGQTLTVELSFSEPQQSLMVRKGGFYQHTGGRWVYLIAEDGLSASRTHIRLGRQNPRYVEVLEGLRPEDRIITSGYEIFNEVDQLIFEQAI